MTFSMAIAISIEPFMKYKRVVSNGFISVYTPSPSMHFLVVATHAIKVIIIIKDCDFNQCQWWKRIKIRIEGEREREIKGEGEMRWDQSQSLLQGHGQILITDDKFFIEIPSVKFILSAI